MKVYKIPFKGFYTRVFTFGYIHKGTPLIILHGGPGGCDEKYEALFKLKDFGIPLIFYDQIGCGLSKIPQGHFELMNYDTYMDELENIVKYFNLKRVHILGHSWGGMLLLNFLVTRKSDFIDKVILFSTLPSTKMWNDEHMLMLEKFPKEYKEVLIKQFKGESYNEITYKEALNYFYDKCINPTVTYEYKNKNIPPLNREIYEYMWGKSELFGSGTLKDWNVEHKLPLIQKNVLLISGKYDESTINMNKFMNERIKGSKWLLLEHSHHVGYNEETDVVLSKINAFLK